ncbi:MAG: F0F1 ATP synthase subunit epsilon [Oligoflexia bacterium]|nr:F0F1 ATP synthase subunit epsilon [Oligoflexia bacterium]
MGAENYTLKLYVPSGLVLQEKVKEVYLPSATGEVGVLSEHAKYTALLGTGVLEYLSVTDEKRRLVLSGGFCTFSDDTFTVLADSAEGPETFSRDRLAADRKSSEAVLAIGDTLDPAWEDARIKLAKVEAAEKLLK